MTAPTTRAALRRDEKAAIVLFSLGSERAKQLFGQMDAAEHRVVARAFNRLGDVSVDQITDVLLEFTSCLQRGRPLQGGVAETREFLLGFLEPGSVDQVMAEIDGVAGSDVWQRLSEVPERPLAGYLSREKPQTMAVILGRLRPDKAAATLALLPEAMAREVVLRLAHMRPLDHEVVQDLQSSVMRDFLTRAGQDMAAGQSRGVIAAMLSEMPPEQAESLMEFLQSESPDIAEAVQEGMFRLQDIPAKVTPAALQIVIRNCDKDTLVLALRLAAQKNPALVDYFLENMSKRAAEQLKEDMEGAGAVRVKDAQRAQAEIIRLIRDLARKGEIVIAGKGDAEAMIE